MNINVDGKVMGILFVGLVFLLTGASVSAQQQQRKGPSLEAFFQRFDTDNDEKLSQVEFPGPEEHFTQFDTDDDGFIDKDEMKEVPPPPRKRHDKEGNDE